MVSVAEKARLEEMGTASDLKARVDRFLEDRFPQDLESTWKRFVTRDIRWKMLVLLLAIVAWFVLAFNFEVVETSVVVPIEYRNVPAHAEVGDSAPAEALVTLSGSERAFRLLDRRILKISLDLNSVKEGTETVPITARDVRRPPNLTVDRIQPDQIQVRLKPPPPAEVRRRTGNPSSD